MDRSARSAHREDSGSPFMSSLDRPRRRPSRVGETSSALAAAGFSALHQLAPALDMGLHPELLRCRLDPPPSCLSLGFADTFDLIEAGDRIANVTGIIERLLAFLRKCKGLRRHPILLPRTEPR